MHVACICTHLISGASAVSLDPKPEDRLFSSSLRSFFGPPCFLLRPGLTQPVLCCFNSVPGALSHSILRFSLRLLRCLRGSLREHDCAISTIDLRSFTSRTSISTILCCEKYKCIFKFSQRDCRYSTDTKFTVRRTNTYIHTYIHTYRHRSRSTR